jgi:hypothetical protein
LENVSPKYCAPSAIYQKLPKVNNRPIGENSPNLFTPFNQAAKQRGGDFANGFSNIVGGQGDQIGRIFSDWAIPFFGQIFGSGANSWATFFHETSYAKSVLGYSLGDFFLTNSSGHTAGGDR